MNKKLHILMVGETFAGSRTPQRRKAFETLGHHVSMVPTHRPGIDYQTPPSLCERFRYRLRVPADPAGANQALINAADVSVDMVWVENARMIRASTLRQVRQKAPQARLVWYSEDDTMNPRHRTRWMEGCIPLYDLWVTTKSFNARPEEVPSLGARRVMMVNNAFDPDTHAPIALTTQEKQLWGSDITFVGTYEAPRAASLVALAQAGLSVRVWGNGWNHMRGTHPNLTIEGRAVYDLDYVRVCAASKINLCFLRRFNRDLQTCRSVELPACGAFMLHEYNHEISALFTEDIEVSYFRNNEDLILKCKKWLSDEEGRKIIALNGRKKAQSSLSNQTILSSIIDKLRGLF